MASDLEMPSSIGDTFSLWTVRPDGERSLAEVVALASSGDRIEVSAGVHQGPVLVDKTLEIEGLGRPVVDGGGRGTVFSVAAPDVEIRGLAIRGSGRSLDEENAGIAVEAPRARISDNRLEDVLFGIYLREASESVISNNVVTGKRLPVPRRGDAIRLSDLVAVDLRGSTSWPLLLEHVSSSS